MIRKALVPAGGRGTRLRPLTHTSAKQLVPVGNKPVLFYCLEALRDAGVEEVGMIIGDTGEEIRAAVGDGSAWGFRVTYLPQERPLGLAHCVRVARRFLGDDDFVMYLGDNFLFGGITDFVREFDSGTTAARLLLTRSPTPEAFGVAEVDATGQVVRLVEKPEVPPSDLVLVGVYLFSPLVHDAVAAIRPSARGELEITDAIQWLIREGHPVRSDRVTGYWKDTGHIEDLLECNRTVLERAETRIDGSVCGPSTLDGRVVVEPGAVVDDSVLRGPLVIGSGSKIIRSYVGPFTSIGEGCVLEDAELEYSIMLSGSSIHGVSRIERSLIGKDVEVVRCARAPLAHQLMVGDHSKVVMRG